MNQISQFSFQMWHHTAPHHYIHKREKKNHSSNSSKTVGPNLSFPGNQIKEAKRSYPCVPVLTQSCSLHANHLRRSAAKTPRLLLHNYKPEKRCHISTFEWGSVSSSWLELEGEGVADLLPGGEGEPWGRALRLTWEFSWDSALMGLGSIGGELFIMGWLRAGS